MTLPITDHPAATPSPMSADALWRRYAALWTDAPAARDAGLLQCVHEHCRYCDPNGEIDGPDALAAYMEGFRQAMPDARFHIERVAAHHGRTSSTWGLRRADGALLQTGRSFATMDEQGRLLHITGFFDTPAAAAS